MHLSMISLMIVSMKSNPGKKNEWKASGTCIHVVKKYPRSKMRRLIPHMPVLKMTYAASG